MVIKTNVDTFQFLTICLEEHDFSFVGFTFTFHVLNNMLPFYMTNHKAVSTSLTDLCTAIRVVSSEKRLQFASLVTLDN